MRRRGRSHWPSIRLEVIRFEPLIQLAARNLVVEVLRKIASDPADKNYLQYKGRAEFYLTRVPEELYNTESDPGCLHNLIHDPASRQVRNEFRVKMVALLNRTQDHELENYQKFIQQ